MLKGTTPYSIYCIVITKAEEQFLGESTPRLIEEVE